MPRPDPESPQRNSAEKPQKSTILAKSRFELKKARDSIETIKQFEDWEINFLKAHEIDITNSKKLKEIAPYKPRFNAEDIIALTLGIKIATADEKMGKIISAKTAKLYPERFDGWSIVGFIQSNIDPQKASSYPERLDSDGIIRLVQAGIDGETAKLYPKRFSAWEITAMQQAGIGLERITSYPKNTDGWKIIKLAQEEVAEKQISESTTKPKPETPTSELITKLGTPPK